MMQSSTSTPKIQRIQLQLLPALQRGNQVIFPMKHPEEAHYSHLISRQARRLMSVHGLKPYSNDVGLEIMAYDNQPHDALGVIKLCMDALNRICYTDDVLVSSVTYQRRTIPKMKNGYAVKPYIEVYCGGFPAIKALGIIRGIRYPLYDIHDLANMAANHELVRKIVQSKLVNLNMDHPSPNQSVEVTINIVQATTKGDIDNISFNYWEALMDVLSLDRQQITVLHITRRTSGHTGTECIHIELAYT